MAANIITNIIDIANNVFGLYGGWNACSLRA